MDRVESNEINSCLMMAMMLETPIDMCYLFDNGDLKRFEPESHITLLYAPGVEIDPKSVAEEIQVLLGPREFDILIDKLKEAEYFPEDWFGTVFELGSFSNDDSDYLILKLIEGDPIADWMRDSFKVINKGMKRKYGVESKFLNYTPHITLAELEPGTVGKYMKDSRFQKVLSNSFLSWSDLVLSIGPSGGYKEDFGNRYQHSITHFNAIDRYFYLERMRKVLEDYKNGD